MSATGAGSSMSHPSGACARHSSASRSKPGIPRAATVPERPGGHEVHPDPARPEVARQIPRDRLERGLGDAHPVVDRPRDGRVEVEPDDARPGPHQRLQRRRQRLERERARLERRGRALRRSGHEPPAERVLGRERDRVQRPVDARPSARATTSVNAARSAGLFTSSSSTSTSATAAWRPARSSAAPARSSSARPRLPPRSARSAAWKAIESFVITPVISELLALEDHDRPR